VPFHYTNELDSKDLIRLNLFSKIFKKIIEFICINKFCHSILKKIQLKYFPKIIKNLMNKDTRVIINDDLLKMHTTDNREKYYNLYKKYLDNLLKQDRYVKKQA